jgi:hypothetical protein
VKLTLVPAGRGVAEKAIGGKGGYPNVADMLSIPDDPDRIEIVGLDRVRVNGSWGWVVVVDCVWVAVVVEVRVKVLLVVDVVVVEVWDVVVGVVVLVVVELVEVRVVELEVDLDVEDVDEVDVVVLDVDELDEDVVVVEVTDSPSMKFPR